MADSFDEHKFAALLTLAGPVVAIELAQRLDEDLTRLDRALASDTVLTDKTAIRAQSHDLLAISGTIGATRLYFLAQQLNDTVRRWDGTPLADLLAETRRALADLIQRVRALRLTLAAPT